MNPRIHESTNDNDRSLFTTRRFSPFFPSPLQSVPAFLMLILSFSHTEPSLVLTRTAIRPPLASLPLPPSSPRPHPRPLPRPPYPIDRPASPSLPLTNPQTRYSPWCPLGFGSLPLSSTRRACPAVPVPDAELFPRPGSQLVRRYSHHIHIHWPATLPHTVEPRPI